jgi:2-isopropylmalate synthase
MLALAKEIFAAATAACADVEFFAEDATRADLSFLGEMIAAAAEAGVKTVTLCDDEGVLLPDEFSAFLSSVKDAIPALSSMNLGILCRNTHGMATASAVMAIKVGASEIKCAVGNADIPDLDTFAGIVNHCGDRQGIYSDMNYNELHRIEKQIRWILGDSRAASAPEAKASIEETASYSKEDSKDTIAAAVAKLGYDLAEADIDRVYEEFCHIAEKKSITAKDLDAVVANVALQVPPTYTLESYVVNNGNVIGASAQIHLMKNGERLSGIAMGDGPIDAAFRTLEQIIGRHFELDEFRIEAVTQGREALGSTLVKLRNNGKLYSGNGLSSDVIGASIRAYVSAVNKIVYEENA